MGYEVKDKIVLVTGANRGIGKAFVDSFVEHGAARIYAAVRASHKAFSFVEEYSEKVIPIHIDLADSDSRLGFQTRIPDSDSIFSAAKTAKNVQIVVNNAGVLTTTTPLDDDAVSSLEFEMNTNVYGLIRMAQAFSPVLKVNGGGAFIQVNSIGAMKYASYAATYCASKAAATSITQFLWELLGAQGTIVLRVHPGPTATDMWEMVGLTKIAQPPSLVPEATIETLKAGGFLVFPGTWPTQPGNAYKDFAKSQSISV